MMRVLKLGYPSSAGASSSSLRPSADLVRLGINWLIEHPDAILKFPQEAA